MQRIADLLVSENWATFESNPDHRGSPHLMLNSHGKATLAELSEAARATRAELARRLAGVDIDAIHRGLRRLIEVMNDRDLASTKRGADL